MMVATVAETAGAGLTGAGPEPTSMREAFDETATRLLDEDLSVALVLADISAGLFENVARRHPDRVINVGIREQLAVNVGAGLALSGMRPIVHTFAPFLVERGFEQIKLGFGHQDVGGVLVSIGASYDNATSGRTHQSPSDVALIATLPGWTIHIPGHPDELARVLATDVAGDGRAYIRASMQSNTSPHPVGRMQVIKRGRGGTVVAVGPMLDAVLAAADGLDLTVLYASTVRPFDHTTLLSTLESANVILVEPYAEGTSSAQVSSSLVHVPHRLLSIGVPPVELRRYGTPDEHEAAYGLDGAGLRAKFTGFLEM